jgi:hypothetical protein
MGIAQPTGALLMWLNVSVSAGVDRIFSHSHGPQNMMIRVEDEAVLRELFPECEVKRLEDGAFRFYSVLPCNDVESVLKVEAGSSKWMEKQYLDFRFRFMGGDMFCASCSVSLAKKCCNKHHSLIHGLCNDCCELDGTAHERTYFECIECGEFFDDWIYGFGCEPSGPYVGVDSENPNSRCERCASVIHSHECEPCAKFHEKPTL